MCSGNWGVDLQAGSEFGYKLLFIVLLAGVFAIVMQVRLIPSPRPVPLRSLTGHSLSPPVLVVSPA